MLACPKSQKPRPRHSSQQVAWVPMAEEALKADGAEEAEGAASEAAGNAKRQLAFDFSESHAGHCLHLCSNQIDQMVWRHCRKEAFHQEEAFQEGAFQEGPYQQVGDLNLQLVY